MGLASECLEERVQIRHRRGGWGGAAQGNHSGSWVFSGLSAEEPNHHHSSRSAPLGELCISLREREIVP